MIVRDEQLLEHLFQILGIVDGCWVMHLEFVVVGVGVGVGGVVAAVVCGVKWGFFWSVLFFHIRGNG